MSQFVVTLEDVGSSTLPRYPKGIIDMKKAIYGMKLPSGKKMVGMKKKSSGGRSTSSTRRTID